MTSMSSHRSSLGFLLGLLSCSVVLQVGLTADAHGAPRQLTKEARRARAESAVKERITPWMRAGTQLKVRGAIGDLGSTARNPITGGAVVVFASQTRPGSRVPRAFDKHALREFLVDVDRHGNVQVLNGKGKSHAIHHKAAALVTEKIPAGEILHDLVNSAGVRDGVFTSIVSGAAVSIHPAISGIGLARAAQQITVGLGNRSRARSRSLDMTARWAKRKGKSAAGYPTLAETYSHYLATLEKVKAGTKPVSELRFAKQLLGYQL